MNESPPLQVLIIEDDRDARENLQAILELDDYDVVAAGSLREALHERDWSRIFAVIVDRKLPDGDAEKVLPTLRQLAPSAALIVATGWTDLAGVISALRLGVVDYILKPINPDLLRATLTRAAHLQQITRDKARSDAIFHALGEQAPCLIVVLRPDWSIAYFGPYAVQLTGYDGATVAGQNYFSLCVPTESQQAFTETLQQVLVGLPARGYESPLRCRDGRSRWVVWNAQRLADFDGGPAVLAVGLDITNLRAAQESAVQQARLAAIGQMMAGLAHESRNALQRSQACLELLGQEVETQPEALDLVNRIQSAQDHLHELYEEVRGYAAPIRLQKANVRLADVWREVWEQLERPRRARQVRLQESPAAANWTAAVDRQRLGQVFRNLFENSLAACPDPAEITVDCRGEGEPGQERLRITVRDNGPGIPPDVRDKMFEPFVTTKTQGTGLGLAICRRIIEAHQGTITAGNGNAPGAAIELVLPAPHQTAAPKLA